MNPRKNEPPFQSAEDAAIDSRLRDDALAQQNQIECNDQFVSRVMQKVAQHKSATQRSDHLMRPYSAEKTTEKTTAKTPCSDRLIRWGFAATAIAAAITCLLVVPFESSQQQQRQKPHVAEQVLAQAGDSATPQTTASPLSSGDANEGLSLVNTGIAQSLRSMQFTKGRLARLLAPIQLAAGTSSDVDGRLVETQPGNQSPRRGQFLAFSNEHFVADLANKILGN